MVTTVSTMCEVAFSLASDQHKPNNAIASIIRNMQHQLSLIGPIKDEMKTSLDYIQSEMLLIKYLQETSRDGMIKPPSLM